jgi:hypothetical protein
VASAKPQLEMVVDDPAQAERDRAQAERDREKDRDAQKAVFDALITACRDTALAHGGYDKAANALDAVWGEFGRHVSGSFLNTTLKPVKPENAGSYFRLEWIIWFAQHSAEVRDLLAGIAFDTPKDPAEDLDDLHDVIREELGKTGEALIRKAKARRRRKR